MVYLMVSHTCSQTLVHNNYTPLSIAGWSLTSEEGQLVLMKVDATRTTPDIWYSLRISADMMWKVFIYGMELPRVTSVATHTPPLLSTVEAVRRLLLSLDKAHICKGNRDGKFEELQSIRGFRCTSSKCEVIVYNVNIFHSSVFCYLCRCVADSLP